MTKMDKSKMLISSRATMSKIATCNTSFGGRAKHAIRTANMKVAKAVKDSAHILRIMTSLHSSKDFPSVLKLYGIEDLSTCPGPIEA
jgi:hypothetical protein